MNKLDYNGILRKQVLNYCNDVPVLIDGFHKGITEPRFLPDTVIKKIDKIFITGSGDCWGAAQILEAAFRKLLKSGGVSTHAFTPIELSRFTELQADDDATLVIVLSVWGFPARLVEVLERASGYHIPSIAITEKDNSPVGQAADYALNVHNSSIALESKSGCCTYLGMLMSGTLLAAYIAEKKGLQPQGTVMKLEEALKAYAKEFQEETIHMDDDIFEVAKSWKDSVEGVIAIGDDTDYASALFFPAKLIESSGIFGGFTNSADWLRTQRYIGKAQNTGVLIYIQKAAPTRARLEQAVKASAKEGFPTLVVSDYPCPAAEGCSTVSNLVLPQAPDTCIGSFFNHLPGDLLASYLCELWEGSYFRSAVIEDTEYGVNHKEGTTIWSKPGINTLQSSKHVFI